MKELQNEAAIFQLRFPFLGARENGESFEYLLMDISPERAQIAISNWMVNYTVLNLQEKVELFIPHLLTVEYDFRNEVSGIITSVSEENQEFLYEVSFIRPLSILSKGQESFEKFVQNLPIDASLINTLLRLIKDSAVLKHGIQVYLRHLSPYFSRIANYPIEDYEDLKKLIFVDVSSQIKKNEEDLKNLYFYLKENIQTIGDISMLINLEELREKIESEINLDLFMIAFARKNSRSKLLDLLRIPEQNIEDKYSYQQYLSYLITIKNLEKRLYSNYNQMVLIYLKTISL